MKRLRIGQLDVALLPSMGDRRKSWTLLIDWRLSELGRRWRLSVGPNLWVPFSERYGYVSKARRWRKLGLDWAWYRRGLE